MQARLLVMPRDTKIITTAASEGVSRDSSVSEVKLALGRTTGVVSKQG